mgnify:CR=1 FL=1
MNKNEESQNETYGFFMTKPVNDWMGIAKTQEDTKMLFDAFWKEGELIIADTPEEMAKRLIYISQDLDQVVKCEQNTKKVAQSGLTISDLTDLIRSSY